MRSMHSWLLPYQQQLSHQIHAARIPHAILFKGIKGAGKKALSQWLVDVLLCQQKELDSTQQIYIPCRKCKSCLLMQSHTFPEHILVTPERNSLGVDAIRAATKSFEKTPQIGNVQAVQIHDAQLMTIAAANALLKTLEEPSDQSYIILESNDADLMLPTIISRCLVIDIRPPSGDALLHQLSVGNTPDLFANLSHLPELQDPDLAESYKELIERFAGFIHDTSNYVSFSTFLIEHEHALRWLEKIIVNLYRSTFSWGETIVFSNKCELSSDILWTMYECIMMCNKKLQTMPQVNHQFVIEHLLTEIIGLLDYSVNTDIS